LRSASYYTAPMQRQKELKELIFGILFLVIGGAYLALAICWIVRHDDLLRLCFSTISALVFIVAGALRLWPGIYPRKQPGDSPVSILRQ